MDRVYTWYQLAKDVAISNDLQADSELQMATELNRAIQTGNVQCWKENGDPIRSAIPLENQRRQVPHLTVFEGNAWLKRNGYLHEWEPAESVVPLAAVNPDYSILATRQELIGAYGSFTGMDMTWFDNVTDSPKLLAARKVRGRGKKGQAIVPLFCPYEVMVWLIDKNRRKGRRIYSGKAWEILEKYFPNVFNIYSAGDSRTD